MPGVVELQSVEFQSLQPQSVTMIVSGTDASSPVRHVDVISASTRGAAAAVGSDNDDDEEYDNFDNDNVVTSRHAPAAVTSRHAPAGDVTSRTRWCWLPASGANEHL